MVVSLVSVVPVVAVVSVVFLAFVASGTLGVSDSNYDPNQPLHVWDMI